MFELIFSYLELLVEAALHAELDAECFRDVHPTAQRIGIVVIGTSGNI